MIKAPYVWRGLTAQEVREQFDMRVAVPDGERFTARRVERSLPIRDSRCDERDCRYGDGPRQLIDVYRGLHEGPIVLFVHGGAWRYQSKEGFAFVAPPLLDAGATVVIPGFDLHPQVTVCEMMAQVRHALEWTVRRFNPSGARRVVIAGHSSGAQLAAMALAWDFGEAGLRHSPVDAALLVSGSYDMEPHRHHPRYADMGLDEDVVQAISPASNPPINHRLPLVLAAGSQETKGYLWQVESFRAKCASRGHPVHVLLSEGDHHYSVVEQLADPAHPLSRALIALALGSHSVCNQR